MKTWFLSVLAAATIVVFAVVAFSASKLPGPPTYFKDWPRSGVGLGRCPDERVLKIDAFSKDASHANVSAWEISDAAGPFVWVLWTEKDEEVLFADARWVAWFDGDSYWMGTPQELLDLFGNSPCHIPRPQPTPPM